MWDWSLLPVRFLILPSFFVVVFRFGTTQTREETYNDVFARHSGLIYDGDFFALNWLGLCGGRRTNAAAGQLLALRNSRSSFIVGPDEAPRGGFSSRAVGRALVSAAADGPPTAAAE